MSPSQIFSYLLLEFLAIEAIHLLPNRNHLIPQYSQPFVLAFAMPTLFQIMPSPCKSHSFNVQSTLCDIIF
jgi:hypothetical protein